MAERRRIIPASVGPLFQPKEEKSWEPAVRFELTLDEPNDTKCSEYSYRELYKNAVGETEADKSFNDLEEEDISGLAAFAKRFEEKYGAGDVDGKKKRREKLDDLMDVGMGYDETDPFVDNSECYDELVPSVLTTQLGGFYINQGQLHFREISGSEDDDDFIHAAKSRKKKTFKTPKKKRKSSFEERERKRRKQEKKAKKQLQKQFGSKKKKVSGSPTVAELLKKRQLLPGASKSSTSSGKLLNGNASNKDNMDPLDQIDPSLDLGISDFKMDSDMAKVMEEALASIQDGDTLGGDEDSMGNGNVVMDDAEQPYVKCPENIPRELMTDVEKIKDAARKSAEGKCKFFTPSVNQLLLRIELQTRDLTCGKRSNLYSHMAANLPCGKETLLKRAKKLRLGAQDVNVKEPLQKLREAIAKVMPENIQRHQEECQTHALEKANRSIEGKEEGRGSDEDDDRKSKQGNFGPRKKFQWTDEIRKLLCEVVSIKVKTFAVIKSRSQSAEEFVRTFLDDEVKPLWPQGWIQTRMLYKESRSIHGHLTSNQPMKPKKVVLATKKSTFKKPSTKALINQSSMSVASMITQAIMSPNSGNSNQSTPVSEKGTPKSDRVPTLLDYANSSMEFTPSPHQKSNLQSNQSTPKSTPTSSSLIKDRPNNSAASLQGTSASGVDFTTSFMEKLIADELAASDKKTPTQAQGQKSQTQSLQPSSSNQAAQLVTKPKTSPPQGQNPMSIAEIVAATAKAMETPVSNERQASSAASVLKQLSTHAQNNTSGVPNQTYITSTKPVVRKVDGFGSGQERLKKLSLDAGKRTMVNIQKQHMNVSGPNMALSQTIQKLSSNLASSRVPTTKGVSSITITQSGGKPTMVSRVAGNVPPKQNTNTSNSGQPMVRTSSSVQGVVRTSINTQAAERHTGNGKAVRTSGNTQAVVRLQRPPTGEKVPSSSQPQVRLASTKSSTLGFGVVTTTKTNAQHTVSNSKSTAQQPVIRTALNKQPKRVNVQTLSKEHVDSQVGRLTPANLQAGMGNIFANLNESLYRTAVSTSPVVIQSSKELPYNAAATSGKHSHPKTTQAAKTHVAYRQQTSPTSHAVHASSYSPTKVTKQQALSSSASAFTAPSPPKLHKQPSTSPTLSPSTSPVGQKYPAYVSQRTSPNQTSPKYPPVTYTTTMAAIPGYQQLSLADLAHKQATSGYTQGYPLNANQGQGSAAAAGQGTGDAIITGPAPGTFYHQAAGSGGMLSPMQSPTEQQYRQLPPWAQ
ncbi:LOW QUALITY PROTEIN: uncharacterized protein [Amphiura filiformis]|uniref:LOW QUALITY PROTEIN: uncharacterized protein n=1 Tax=Amphiura filiformis TaxID=82378 RepID=UPI003B21A121